MWVNEYDCGRWPRGVGEDGESARMPRVKKYINKKALISCLVRIFHIVQELIHT